VSQPAHSTSFMIFANQRTGSTWLMDMLDMHPAVASYDELLRAGASGRGKWGRTDQQFFEPYYTGHHRNSKYTPRALWLYRYLDQFYSPRRGTEAIGMKLMYDQLRDNPWTLTYMVRHRIRVVHLVRTNLLDVIISAEAAEARQQYHAWQSDPVEVPVLTLNPATVTSRLAALERVDKVARSMLTVLRIKHIEISYEQLMADSFHVSDVLTFLDVNTQPGSKSLDSRFKKLNTARKRDMIDNYAEVMSALEGTRFERFLHDESESDLRRSKATL
jgi:LPS sulfotransferase NodH